MKPKYDIAVIGAGAAGLSVAAGAAQIGAKVIIVEKAPQMGGDCLHYGCVPSKTLIHSAHVAHTFRTAERFGTTSAPPKVDMQRVMGRVADVIGQIQPHDSVERFEGLGCEVLVGSSGAFEDSKTFAITAGSHMGKKITARKFVISTGSRPFVPPIEGIDSVHYYTNETIFGLKTYPQKMLIIGGGPIGAEMAQSFQRLGVEVTVILGPVDRVLPRDDQDAAMVVMKKMESEGITFVPNAKAHSVIEKNGMIQLTIQKTDGTDKRETYSGDTLLIATGRQPNVEHLGLENAGVDYARRGITTNSKLQTTTRNIYACGDVVGKLLFTHIAGYQAGVILRNILSPFALYKLCYSDVQLCDCAVPWTTYTDPELAQVGMSESQAQEQGVAHKVYRFDFAQSDRAKAEGAPEGFIKAICTPKGKILGATIVGRSAGELTGTWIVAINKGLKITELTGMIFPYPTLGEVSKYTALQALKASFTPTKKKILKKLLGLRGK